MTIPEKSPIINHISSQDSNNSTIISSSELLTGRVLFPGSEAMEQYKLIIRLCGSPDEELIRKIEQTTSPAMRMVIQRLGEGCSHRCNFPLAFPHCPPDAVDLLDRLLVLDPDRRISVEEALQHEYMREYSMPSDEPTVERPFDIDIIDAGEGAAVVDQGAAGMATGEGEMTRSVDDWKGEFGIW